MHRPPLTPRTLFAMILCCAIGGFAAFTIYRNLGRQNHVNYTVDFILAIVSGASFGIAVGLVFGKPMKFALYGILFVLLSIALVVGLGIWKIVQFVIDHMSFK